MIISNGVTFRAGNRSTINQIRMFRSCTYADLCQLKTDDRNFLILIVGAMLQVTPFEKGSPV